MSLFCLFALFFNLNLSKFTIVDGSFGKQFLDESLGCYNLTVSMKLIGIFLSFS